MCIVLWYAILAQRPARRGGGRRGRPPDLEPALHRFDNNTIVENLNYVL